MRSVGGASLKGLRRTLLGPRPGILIGFALLVLALLGAFTWVVFDSQSQSRREAERRFAAEAKISAELTAAIFTSTAGSSQAAAAKALGGRTVDERALTSMANRSRSRYVLLLGADGKLLAASRGTPAAIRDRVATESRHIHDALAGRPALSDLVPAGGGRGAFQGSILKE